MRTSITRMVAAAVVWVGAAASSLSANETDQFTLPTDRPFADLGPYFTAVHYRILEGAVERLNAGIDSVRWMSEDQQVRAELGQYYTPATVANAVRYQFLPGFIDTIAIENAVLSGAAQECFPGHIVGHKQWDWVYFFAHLPIDPRNVPLMFQSSTVKVYGSYIGTDKIAHFHDLGHIYYVSYLRQLSLGKTEEEATRWVVRAFADGLVSEGAFIGFIASGVFSNGDLASNYVGMKFYKNLTEPVMLKGKLLPPMLVRVGDYWALNHHVRPESDFFEPFVSDHFNEALNPSLFEWGLRRSIKSRIERNAENIVRFYADLDGRPRDIAYFDNLARELSTYYGEDYGGRGVVGENLLSIGSTCLVALGYPEAGETAVAANGVEVENEPAARQWPAWVSGVQLGTGLPPREAQWARGRRLLGSDGAIETARATEPEPVSPVIMTVGGGSVEAAVLPAHQQGGDEEGAPPQ